MKKNIHEVIEKEALDILKETYHDYENNSVFKSVSFEEVLEAQANYLEAKRNRHEIKELNQKDKGRDTVKQ